MERILKSPDKFHIRFKKHGLFLRNVNTLASNSVDGARKGFALFEDLHRLESKTYATIKTKFSN